MQSSDQLDTIQLAGEREFAVRVMERQSKSLLQVVAALRDWIKASLGCGSNARNQSRQNTSWRRRGLPIVCIARNCRTAGGQMTIRCLLHKFSVGKARSLIESKLARLTWTAESRVRGMLTCFGT